MTVPVAPAAAANPYAWVGMGTMSLVSSMASQSQENQQLEDAAAAHGLAAGATRFAARQRGENLISRAADIERNKVAQQLAITAAAQDQEAQARVNAAFAGVAGDSVDDTIAAGGKAGAWSTQQVEEIAKRQKQQVRQDFTDIMVNASSAEGTFVGRPARTSATQVGLTFAQSYMNAQAPTL